MTSGKGEILFSGILPSNLKKPEFKKREGPPNWFTILEQAFFQATSTEKGKLLYGDPEKGGATVEQVWRTYGLTFGLRPVCLFTTDKGPITTGAIQKVVELDSKDLVNVLSEILSLWENTTPKLPDLLTMILGLIFPYCVRNTTQQESTLYLSKKKEIGALLQQNLKR
jgi:hypothetical protein